ncbi:hypothetical protein TNCV_2935191 [Trichonephila clavipes]|nr:hypothetical protein TNCV_2935191 [Trichonephila clavipes]
MEHMFSIGERSGERAGQGSNSTWWLTKNLWTIVPCLVAHYPVEIWLWPSSEGKEGQLAPTPRRCSASCLKYRQCVLEEYESDIQYRPIP